MTKATRSTSIVIALGSLGFALSACQGCGLTASSTCKDFLSESASDEQGIVASWPVSTTGPDYATPLGGQTCPITALPTRT